MAENECYKHELGEVRGDLLSSSDKLFIIRQVENHGLLFNAIVTEDKPGEWVFWVSMKNTRVMYRGTKENCKAYERQVVDFQTKVQQRILGRYE